MLVCPPSTFSQTKVSDSTAIVIRALQQGLAEVQRDQLNYRIEKDLLRETFSTNFQTINTILTIVLALFTILGFLGIRDIGTIRKEYLAELDKLNNLHKDFEIRIGKYDQEINKLRDDYLKVTQTTEKQDSRLRSLEVLEKSQMLRSVGNYRAALDAVSSALEGDPGNVDLLYDRGMSLYKLDDYPAATQAFKQVWDHDLSNYSALTNLLELYLITGHLKEYTDLREASVSILQGSRNATGDALYFDVLESYQSGTYEQLKARVKAYTEYVSFRRRKSDWDFTDAQGALHNDPMNKKKELLMLFFDIATRKIDINVGRKSLGMTPLKGLELARKMTAANKPKKGARH